MSLELSQLYRLLNGPHRGSIELGYLPQTVADYLKSPLGIAYLSAESLKHILDKHQKDKPLEAALLEMLCLPAMIKNALWIGEPARTACMTYLDPGSGKQFKGAVKSAAMGYEIYLSTFHLCGPRQAAALLKRGPILQHQK
jgi:hypothetical protein